ncbi:MAG: S41 family peptidase [Endomicrobia bacterium]|nr:S41 family peptidase [Endomicrobiia bacterium]MCL2799529.1 S41 family peptidase [Endomicrobiia bacterium]
MKNILKMFLTAFIVCSLCTVNLFAASDETYDKLKLMVDIMEIINANYVSETDAKNLVTGAIHGVVKTLDPFSQYMEEKAYKDMRNETEGAYSGVGLRIMVKNNFITVVSPLPGTPAYRAGILPDDRIIKIDSKSAIGMPSDEAVDLMRGKAGAKVKLTISRDNVLEDLEFTLVREKIKIETVKSVLLDGGIAYVRLSEFNAQSATDLNRTLTDYSKQGMTAVILDLRNDPGGLLDSAIDIISMFIKDKTLALTTKGRSEEMKKEYFTRGGGEFSDIPLVILVNRGSASASEIVAGAMQDFRRALIIGSNTFGKGSVQTVIPLSDGTALRLTIAKYYLPSGRPINRSDDNLTKNGINPDIEIKVTIEDEIKLYAQSDMIFSKDKNPKPEVADENKIEDAVLNKAIEIIREGRVFDMIKESKALEAAAAKEVKKDDKKGK